MREIIAPPGIAPPAANYALGVVTTDTGRWLHTAGIVGVAPDGTVPADVVGQARQVWENIAVIVDEASMALTDIAAVTTYVVAGTDLAPVMAARDVALGDHLAASTLVTVAALARPEWLVEVAVVAAT